MFKFLFISLCFLVSFRGISQDSIAVHFMFPSDGIYEIQVDEVHIYNKKDFFLVEGHHKIEIWVQGLQLRTDSIIVNSDSYNLYKYKVTKPEPTIPSYRKDKFKYVLKSSIPLSSYIPTGVLGYFMVSKYFEAKSIFSEVEDLKYSYALSLNSYDIQSHANRVNNLNRLYDKKKKDYRLLGVSTISMLFVNIGLTYLFNKFNEKPVKYHKVSPFDKNSPRMSFYFGVTGFALKLTI